MLWGLEVLDNPPAVVLLRPRWLRGGGGLMAYCGPRSVYACLEEEQRCCLKHGSVRGMEKWQRRKEVGLEREEIHSLSLAKGKMASSLSRRTSAVRGWDGAGCRRPVRFTAPFVRFLSARRRHPCYMLSGYKPGGLSRSGLSSMGTEVTDATLQGSPPLYLGCSFSCLWGSVMTSCLQLWSA